MPAARSRSTVSALAATCARRDDDRVPAHGDGEELILATVATTERVERTVIDGIAPGSGSPAPRGRGAAGRRATARRRGVGRRASRAGRRALATELLATGRAMLRMAREHALAREQFGRPIAQFQAVRHRLADTYVALEAADAAVVSAWDVPGPLTAILAKSLAGRGVARSPPRTASRCSPASASRPTTRCTAT